MKVGELCERLDVSYRDARYVLEEGILPKGVDENPGKGDHRDLTNDQAFWLAIVLLLKQNGVKPLIAGKIASYASSLMQYTGPDKLGYDVFEPADGLFNTGLEWYLDIGDLRSYRMETISTLGKNKFPEIEPWRDFETHELAQNNRPLVIIRIDIGGIKHRLDKSM